MADSSLSFHCIVCYEVFDNDVNYPVVLPCGHTYVCVNCANRLTKCMECRTSLLYPLEIDPAYHMAIAAAEKEEKVAAAANRQRRGPPSAVARALNANKPPIRVKPEDRMRLPAPKNLVLLSLMEATIGTMGASNSTDHGDDALPTGEDEDKRITAGINIVTGGCGTYAVSSRTGVMVYPHKQIALEDTSIRVTHSMPAPPSKDIIDTPSRSSVKRSSVATPVHTPKHLPSNGNSNKLTPAQSPCAVYPGSMASPAHPRALDHIFCSGANILSAPTLESHASMDGGLMFTSTMDASSFRLAFGDHVQVVEMESDGWAKLARGKGYILAEHEHGSDLVKVGGPKDKACLIEGMMYSVLRRYVTLQNDQDELIRILEGLRRDLNVALIEGNDYTIVPAECLSSVEVAHLAYNDGDLSPKENRMTVAHAAGKADEHREEDEESKDSFYPTKPPTAADSGRNAESTEGQSFLGNLPVIGRFVCGADYGAQEEMPVSASPRSQQRRRELADSVLRAYRDDSPLIQSVPTGVDFRTGMSGHKALLSTHSHSHEVSRGNPRLMSVHSGVAYTRRRPWSKASVEASFASFPGVTRRPSPYSASGNITPLAGNRRTSTPGSSEGGRSISHPPTPSDLGNLGNSFVARMAVARAPSSVCLNPKPLSGSSRASVASVSSSSTAETSLQRNGTPLHRLDNLPLKGMNE